jgi:ribosomal-protein-alanine N-acetyltransferase
MIENDIRIENERLLIHGLTDRDLDALTAMREDARVYRYEPSFLAELQGTPEEALEAIRRMDLEEDRQCILGIYEKADPDALAGLVELYDYKPSGKVVSIGYRLRPEYWGRGIATESVHAIIAYLRNNTQIELITAHVIPENQASGKVLSKNGFQYLLTKTEDWGLGQPTVADVYTYDC